MAVLRILAIVLLYAKIGTGQIDIASVPLGEDLRDLYLRAAASRFVVIGSVERSERGRNPLV